MRQNQYIKFLFLLLFLSAIISCTQEEGIGGSGKIQGVVVEKYYNHDFSVFQYEAPASDQDVFIQFGDNNVVDDDIETSHTGNFEFNYLWPGNYRIFYYSDDTSLQTLEDIAMVHDVKLGKSETYTLDTLYTYKALDWDDGTSKIKGRVILINYKNSSTPDNLVIKDITPAQEQEIYLTYNNEDFYCERIRTQGDGTFVFSNLLIGKYTIFVYSEDVETGDSDDVVIEVEVEISHPGQTIKIEDDIIIKKI
ncbi:MAG: hypothetical protein JXR50_07270 [Prolixibacteraceae bacterium]|nr:hypothetical protein [Prolixibacteraceae bacterium]MBN2649524.1 hypothetical protein [Prolixibacteraceae bacterium]